MRPSCALSALLSATLNSFYRNRRRPFAQAVGVRLLAGDISLLHLGLCIRGTRQSAWFLCLFLTHTVIQLLDVLNSHFQTIFGIGKTQSTLLQLAYFVSNSLSISVGA